MPKSLKERIVDLEKQNKALSKALKKAVADIVKVQNADRKKAVAVAKKVNRYPYVKSVRLAVPRTGRTVMKPLIPTSNGFAVLSEVMGKFEGRGERIWIGTKRINNINYWCLFGHSRQPDVYANAFVFKYPKAN